MRIFGRAKARRERYDAARLTPAIRVSVCTGERVAGFRENATGRFREVLLLRNEADLEEFRREYGIDGEIREFF